jgi:hypothetical protein
MNLPGRATRSAGPGYGYDLANSQYFTSAEIKHSAILDIDQLLADQMIRTTALSDIQERIDVGTSIEEYTKSISTSVGVGGSYGLFRSSVDTSFNVSSTVSSSKAFLTDKAEIRKRHYWIQDGAKPDTLAAYLTDAFKKDVNDPSVAPATLFDEYGTHLPFDLGYGGRLNMNYLHENSSQESSSSLEVKASAGFGVISGSTDDTKAQQAKQLEENSSIVITSTGGYGVSVNVTSIEAAEASYGPWEGTIDDANPKSLSFIGSPAANQALDAWATPVWTFASDPARDAALQAEFEAELEANSAYFDTLQQPATYVKDIYVGSAAKSDAAAADLRSKIPAGEPFVVWDNGSWDLNRKAGGDYIYLWYQVQTPPAAG